MLFVRVNVLTASLTSAPAAAGSPSASPARSERSRSLSDGRMTVTSLSSPRSPDSRTGRIRALGAARRARQPATLMLPPFRVQRARFSQNEPGGAHTPRRPRPVLVDREPENPEAGVHVARVHEPGSSSTTTPQTSVVFVSTLRRDGFTGLVVAGGTKYAMSLVCVGS